MIAAPSSAYGFRAVLALCLAEVLTMVGVFSFPALLPGFVAEWGLSGTEAGWISGAVFGAYAVAVPVLTALTDRFDARRVYVLGAVLAAMAAAGFALTATGFWSAMAWRGLAGFGLAGTYMPGLKALVDRTGGPSQTRWISFYTASFSLGTSLSFLITGEMAVWLGWQAAFGLAAVTAALAALLVLALLRPVTPPSLKLAANPFDFGPVLKNRAAMAYVLGYATHVWELFGARSWMVAFLAWVLAAQPGATGPAPTTIATIAGLIAVAASIGGADLASRLGRKRVCGAAMIGSAAMAVVIGFCGGLPYGWVAVLMLAYNALIQIDSAALTTGAVLAAQPERRGATIAVHSLLGFAAGFVGPLAFGAVLDWSGAATGLGWGLAFASLGVVAALGPLALRLR